MPDDCLNRCPTIFSADFPTIPRTISRIFPADFSDNFLAELSDNFRTIFGFSPTIFRIFFCLVFLLRLFVKKKIVEEIVLGFF